MSFHRVEMDVFDVFLEIHSIANSMIGEAPLPDFQIRLEFLLCAIGEAALDELNCALQSYLRSEEQMKMIGHQDEFVEEICFASAGKESFEEKPGPGFSLEKGAVLPRLRRDKVGLRVVRGMLASGFQNLPSGAKAQFPSDPLRHGSSRAPSKLNSHLGGQESIGLSVPWSVGVTTNLQVEPAMWQKSAPG